MVHVGRATIWPPGNNNVRLLFFNNSIKFFYHCSGMWYMTIITLSSSQLVMIVQVGECYPQFFSSTFHLFFSGCYEGFSRFMVMKIICAISSIGSDNQMYLGTLTNILCQYRSYC